MPTDPLSVMFGYHVEQKNQQLNKLSYVAVHQECELLFTMLVHVLWHGHNLIWHKVEIKSLTI